MHRQMVATLKRGGKIQITGHTEEHICCVTDLISDSVEEVVHLKNGGINFILKKDVDVNEVFLNLGECVPNITTIIGNLDLSSHAIDISSIER